jgi:hypothetical protein
MERCRAMDQRPDRSRSALMAPATKEAGGVSRTQHPLGRRRPWQVRNRDPAGHERVKASSGRVTPARSPQPSKHGLAHVDWTDPRVGNVSVADSARQVEFSRLNGHQIHNRSRRLLPADLSSCPHSESADGRVPGHSHRVA